MCCHCGEFPERFLKKTKLGLNAFKAVITIFIETLDCHTEKIIIKPVKAYKTENIQNSS